MSQDRGSVARASVTLTVAQRALHQGGDQVVTATFAVVQASDGATLPRPPQGAVFWVKTPAGVVTEYQMGHPAVRTPRGGTAGVTLTIRATEEGRWYVGVEHTLAVDGAPVRVTAERDYVVLGTAR